MPALARAIAPAFQTAPGTPPAPPEAGTTLIAQGRIGEALLLAIRLIETGLQGELVKVAEGL